MKYQISNIKFQMSNRLSSRSSSKKNERSHQVYNSFRGFLPFGKLRVEMTNPGFTLIELLVVIAIIGILATLLMSNFIGIRQRARDGKRKSDVAQMQAALEQYRADNSAYPASLPSCTNAFVYPAGCTPGDSGCLVYMKKIPCDPFKESGQTYYNDGSYYYSSSGTTYTIGACLENSSDSQATSQSPDGNTISGCSTAAYYVANNP